MKQLTVAARLLGEQEVGLNVVCDLIKVLVGLNIQRLLDLPGMLEESIIVSCESSGTTMLTAPSDVKILFKFRLLPSCWGRSPRTSKSPFKEATRFIN